MMKRRTAIKGRKQSQETDARPRGVRRSWRIDPLVVGLLMIVVLATVVARVRLLDAPLERDEGEYAYAGQLILRGLVPYAHVYSMKLPGVFLAYAGILAAFGSTVAAIRATLLVVNLATALLLFFLGRRLIGPTAGSVAATSFAVLSMSPSVQGMFANTEHFVLLFVVGGLLSLLRGLERGRIAELFSAGLLLGVAILMKQHGALFAVPAAYQILLVSRANPALRWTRVASHLALFATALVAPYALTCVVLAIAGAFDKFWFWTVEYAWNYSSRYTLAQGWSQFLDRSSQVVAAAPLLWILAGVGLSALAWDPVARKRSPFILMLAGSSFVAISAGFYFRPHYLLLMLPVAALLTGTAVSAIVRKVSVFSSPSTVRTLSVVLVVLCVAAPLYHERELLFRLSPVEVTRAVYTLNPFPESVEIGRFIRSNTREDDTIAVFGSEPQIYFYANRRSATKYIYMYAMMEQHGRALEMQQEMIRQVEAAEPEFMVYVRTSGSWSRNKGSPRLSGEWYQQYASRYYERVGLVQIDPNGTSYNWGPDVPWPPDASRWIEIVRRKH
jgi:hypothetical protein